MTECRIDRQSAEPTTPDVNSSPVLAAHTTLRVGGPADRFVVATSERELIDTVTDLGRSFHGRLQNALGRYL